MGYACYEITRNGERIQAGYEVAATCEKKGCRAAIDRGLAYLCGQTPGGDEHGCGGYFCEKHLAYTNQCETCGTAADEANSWTHPDTGEEFDLRDSFLPAGQRYDGSSLVWRYAGRMRDGSPVLEPTYSSGEKAGEPHRLLVEGEWESAAVVMMRQIRQLAS